MKEAMKIYFDNLIAQWKESNNSLPMTVLKEDISPEMYVEIVDEEYVYWNAQVKNIKYDFRDIEQEFCITLHEDIKAYFNTYWFLEMSGMYKVYNVVLEPVVLGIDLNRFYINLKNYASTHNNMLKYIPIGIEVNRDIVVVNNDTGEVFLEEFDTGEYDKLSDNLKILIKQM